MESLCQSSVKASATAAEVAEILYPVAGLGPVDDAGNIFTVCKEEMNKLIYASLDFVRFKNDKEEFLNVLPEELGLILKDRVETEYQAFLDNLDMEGMIADAEAGVLERAGQYASENVADILPEALEIMMSKLSACAGEYERMGDDSVDDTALVAAYEAARKNTLVERISDTNSKDILIYRQEMIEYLEKACAVRMYKFFERFYSILSCSSIFIELKHKFVCEDVI